MDLFLRTDLIKGDEGRGEQRGGNYVARIQTGYEKDGSPRYKYFRSLKDRDKYLESRGKTEPDEKKKDKDIKEKVKEEHKTSTEKTKTSQGKVESGSLFVKDKKSEKTNKSLSVFIWRIE